MLYMGVRISVGLNQRIECCTDVRRSYCKCIYMQKVFYSMRLNSYLPRSSLSLCWGEDLGFVYGTFSIGCFRILLDILNPT